MSTDEYFREQVFLLGQSPLAWVGNYQALRRAADVLRSVTVAGRQRLSLLEAMAEAMEAPLLPGESRTRMLTKEESVAAVDAMSLGSVALFVLALAMECLIKAHLINNGEQVVDTHGVVQDKFISHNLRTLAGRTTLILADEDLRLLDLLYAVIRWQGRYPMPLKWEELRKFTTLHAWSIGEVEAKS